MATRLRVAVIAVWVAAAVVGFAQTTQPRIPKTCSERNLLRDDKGKIVWFTHEQMKERATKTVNVKWPTAPMQARITGEVTVGVVVARNGKPECVWGISGHPMLAPRVIEAARKWEFNPESARGKAVAFSGVLGFKVTNSVWSY